MAWLSNWSKRIKITIDKDQVDSDLTNFPVPIYLSASSGQSNDDVSAIFDELITVSGTKKIAITTSDEETQCYTEIERWDWSNEKAWLHVNAPTIVSGTDTDLYIYYDSTQPDNTAYVGDVGDTPAQSVWDSNFKAVYHLGEDPNGDVADAIKDSTSNVNHGTPVGAMTSADLVDGQFGKALDFDGGDDYIDCGSSSGLQPGTGAFTGECVVKSADMSVRMASIGKQIQAPDYEGWVFRVSHSLSDSKPHILLREDPTHYIAARGGTVLSNNILHHLAFIYDGSETFAGVSMYVNGGIETLTDESSALMPSAISSATAMHIASAGDTGTNFFGGKADEVRISDTIRAAEWIKATYEGLWDDLLTFGVEEEEPVFYYEGYITVESTPAARIINLYKRDTGELMDSTTSSGSNGYFKLGSSYDDYHFVVALPDLSENYAILTDDKIHPSGGN